VAACELTPRIPDEAVEVPMKILVSAFACLPGFGSEGGVGWYWALEWAKEHEVVVLTDITRRATIEAELARNPRSNPRFVYFRPPWLMRVTLNSWTAQLLFLLWQIGAVPFVRRLHAHEGFDLIHHATYGVFRQPSLLGRVGVPLVFGPVGGGEDAPWRLKQSMPPRNKLLETLRALANRWARIDPLLRNGLDHSALILAKTAATAHALPAGFEGRTKVALEIGTVPRPGVVPRSAPIGRPLHLMYAGNFLAWKGIHLGLRAVAKAVAAGADLRYTIIGNGPMAARLKVLAATLGLQSRIEWIERLPQAELFARYRDFDALLFPSLHDSSGNVVMEALSFGLPVVCFDLGGPADIVTAGSGCVVPTAGRDEAGVTDAMAQALLKLQREPGTYEALSVGALERAKELDWADQAARIKAWALDCVESDSRHRRAIA
jgi:glycosyltransferase involved in cell wall biosynthesis